MGYAEADVVVIGAGIGGMCARALLACSGYRTVVLERLRYPGGRYTAIAWHGYTIPTGGHIVNYGEEDPIYRTLEEVAPGEVDFRELRIPVRYRIGGKDHELKGKGGFGAVIAAASRNEAESRRVMEALYGAMRGELPPEGLSLERWLAGLTDNQAIHRVLRCQARAFTGTGPEDLPAAEYVRFVGTYARRRAPLVPRGMGRSVIEALRRALVRSGGALLTGARATRIVVGRGSVRAVVAERGGSREEIAARVVISNVGPRGTVELVGAENFPSRYVAEIEQRVRPSVAMSYIVVSDRPLVDCLLFTPQAARTEAWCPVSGFWPGEAPPGKHLLEGYASPICAARSDRRAERQAFLTDLRREFPTYAECGAKVLLARRFAGKWPVNRCLQGHDPEPATPIRGLYNVGDGVKPSGWVGASAAALGARRVVEAVRRCG